MLGKASTNHKLPLEKQLLRQVFDKFAFATSDKIQILAIIFPGFTAVLRGDDLFYVKLCDIFFHEFFMTIFLEQ